LKRIERWRTACWTSINPWSGMISERTTITAASSGRSLASAHQPLAATLPAVSTRHHAMFIQNAESRCSGSSSSRWISVVWIPCSSSPWIRTM
jgi:hypothetical protein